MWKWTKKLFVHLLYHTILNSHILLQFCGSKLLHRYFRLTLVRNVAELARPQPHLLQTVGRLSALATRIGHAEEWVAYTGLLNWNEDGLCSVSWPYKKETPNSDKVWHWTVQIWIFQRLPHKGTVLGSKSQWQVMQGDYHVQGILLIRCVIIISRPSNIFLTAFHVLLFSVVLRFILV